MSERVGGRRFMSVSIWLAVGFLSAPRAGVCAESLEGAAGRAEMTLAQAAATTTAARTIAKRIARRSSSPRAHVYPPGPIYPPVPHLSLIGMENVRVRPGGNGFSVWVEGRLRRRGPARQVSVFFDVGDAASPTWQQYLIFVVADEFGNTTKPRQMDRQELTELWTVLQPIVENYKQMPAYRFSDTMKEDAQAAERLLGWIGESLKRTAP